MPPRITRARHRTLGSAVALLAAGTLFTGCAVHSDTRPSEDSSSTQAASPAASDYADPMPTNPGLDFAARTLETFVVAVIDARTIVVSNERARDSDADTGNEMTIVLPGLEVPLEGECGAEEATEGLEAALPVGNIALINIDATHPVDDNGHQIALVTNGGLEDISQSQVRYGFATVDIDSGVPGLDDYTEAQTKAEAEDQGLWETCLANVKG